MVACTESRVKIVTKMRRASVFTLTNTIGHDWDGFGAGGNSGVCPKPAFFGKKICLSVTMAAETAKAAAKRTVVTVLLLPSQLMLWVWRCSHGHRRRIASADDMRPPRCRRRGLNLLAAIERAETLCFIPVFFVGGRLVDVVLKRAGGALPTGTEATRGVLDRLADRHLESLHGRGCRVAR